VIWLERRIDTVFQAVIGITLAETAGTFMRL
jgi:hypothetical protein